MAAAKAVAGLPCITIPNPHADPSRFTAADLPLTSAAEMTLPAALTPSARG